MPVEIKISGVDAREAHRELLDFCALSTAATPVVEVNRAPDPTPEPVAEPVVEDKPAADKKTRGKKAAEPVEVSEAAADLPASEPKFDNPLPHEPTVTEYDLVKDAPIPAPVPTKPVVVEEMPTFAPELLEDANLVKVVNFIADNVGYDTAYALVKKYAQKARLMTPEQRPIFMAEARDIIMNSGKGDRHDHALVGVVTG